MSPTDGEMGAYTMVHKDFFIFGYLLFSRAQFITELKAIFKEGTDSFQWLNVPSRAQKNIQAFLYNVRQLKRKVPLPSSNFYILDLTFPNLNKCSFANGGEYLAEFFCQQGQTALLS